MDFEQKTGLQEDEMKGFAIVLAVVLCGMLLFAGCATSTCESIEGECGGGQDVIDECVEDYKDGDSDCKKALRDMADCVEDKGCDDSCTDEMMKVADKC
jgi:hypothetical protein